MTSKRRSATIAATIVVQILLAVSCTSGGGDAGADRATTSTTSSTTIETAQCRPPRNTTPLDVTAVADSQQDFDLVSFDSTRIRMHWFPHPGATAENPHPTVMMGPGWSLAGATDVDGPSVLGSVDIGVLRTAGYNVLTWDPRGFGESSGTAMVDSVDFEARDVSQMIDWIASLPTVQTDGGVDPRMGMVGGSYGGGIQLVSAAVDCRIDALVPIVAWHSLKTSLFKSETIKIGWANALAKASADSSVDPHVADAREQANSTGVLSQENQEWFVSRGPGELVAKIKVPTLFVAGTVDTLFTLDEAVTNYSILKRIGIPTAMLWVCDGHGVCLTDPGDESRLPTATVKWLDRYVKQNTSVDTGPEFDLIDQNGVPFHSDGFRVDTTESLTGSGSGELDLVAVGGAGPANIPADNPSLLAGLVGDLTPAAAQNAAEVPITADGSDALIVGPPKLSVSYSGSPGTGDRPQRIFAQLVDDTGLVVGNQITPIKVVLDNKAHSTEVPMEMVAFSLKAGSKLTLQLVASTGAYADPQFGGHIRFNTIVVDLPVDPSLVPSG